MCHVCGVKIKIAPCEAEMFRPKCGLIKENIFSQSLVRQTEKNKRDITCSEWSNIIYNADILLIQQVVVIYHALNEFVDFEKNI